MILRFGALFGVCFTLSACTSAGGGVPTVRTLDVPIAVPCRADIGPEPEWPDTDRALKSAPDLFARVRLLAAGRLLRIARDRELSAALEACAG
jgi:hypothetical protein